ncbi:hypothetical protein BS47DRAFT_1328764 [Hydnum rufescens UP504]|uniref:EXPERA domain-containing protein n=1 Tax=Hydnum rufescens UP504 TaxID=1448309 RepID=A0A9P6AZ72_9AGAM|nr:hypothetical protein BS47DRAFT_1328764 [Hydnum rufescens UP504]
MSTVFTFTSLCSLAAVVVALGFAIVLSRLVLPKNASPRDRRVFVWLSFDALIHFFLEGSFLYLSVFGRTVHRSSGAFAEMWKEYARADLRWGVADPTVVSLELLTVLGVGPLCCYVLYLISRKDAMQHYWIIVLSTMELYGGFMTFGPEWLVGSPNLNTSNPMYTWLYLAFMNLIWVFIPAWLLFDSYGSLAHSLPASAAKKGI